MQQLASYLELILESPLQLKFLAKGLLNHKYFRLLYPAALPFTCLLNQYIARQFLCCSCITEWLNSGPGIRYFHTISFDRIDRHQDRCAVLICKPRVDYNNMNGTMHHFTKPHQGTVTLATYP